MTMSVEAPPLPPAAPTGADAVTKKNAGARLAIAQLEAQQARAVREFLLGDQTALSRLRGIDNAIAALRPDITDGAPP